jgi:hypothetical protein
LSGKRCMTTGLCRLTLRDHSLYREFSPKTNMECIFSLLPVVSIGAAIVYFFVLCSVTAFLWPGGSRALWLDASRLARFASFARSASRGCLVRSPKQTNKQTLKLKSSDGSDVPPVVQKCGVFSSFLTRVIFLWRGSFCLSEASWSSHKMPKFAFLAHVLAKRRTKCFENSNFSNLMENIVNAEGCRWRCSRVGCVLDVTVAPKIWKSSDQAIFHFCARNLRRSCDGNQHANAVTVATAHTNSVTTAHPSHTNIITSNPSHTNAVPQHITHQRSHCSTSHTNIITSNPSHTNAVTTAHHTPTQSLQHITHRRSRSSHHSNTPHTNAVTTAHHTQTQSPQHITHQRSHHSNTVITYQRSHHSDTSHTNAVTTATHHTPTQSPPNTPHTSHQ